MHCASVGVGVVVVELVARRLGDSISTRGPDYGPIRRRVAHVHWGPL
jgi:hypothetical protein